MARLLTLIITLHLAVPVVAAPRAGDEILAALQNRLETGGEVGDLVRQLDDLPLDELKKVHLEFERAWNHVRDAYFSAFENEARDQNSGSSRQENASLVRALRSDFLRVKGMGEGPMKEALKKTSRPALTQLQELLLPTVGRILDIAGEPLQKQRRQALALATFRDGLLTAMVATEESNSTVQIHDAEKKTAEDYSGLDREGVRVMRDNRKVAEKAELPEPERLGIEELNTMRLLVGLRALRLDPKLCEAARGHSEDMKTHNFFAHTSPLPGKRSPGDRARLAGTSGGGENIFMGSRSPQAANKGWFYSPGHHKNMFNGGYGRVGLGNYGSHWTQMFGG